MDGLTRRLHRFQFWPALMGLSLALGISLTAFDASAHIVPPGAAPTVPLPSLFGSIDPRADAAQWPDVGDTDLLMRILAQLDTPFHPVAPDNPFRHFGGNPQSSVKVGNRSSEEGWPNNEGRSPRAQPPTLEQVPDPATTARIQQGYGRLPMHFEPNQGQTDAAVRYLARGAGYSLFLTDAEAVLVLRKGGVAPASSRPEASAGAGSPAPFSPFSFQRSSVGMPSWPLQRPGSLRDAGASGLAPTPERSSLYTSGSMPSAEPS
jgi:hypothetical protein